MTSFALAAAAVITILLLASMGVFAAVATALWRSFGLGMPLAVLAGGVGALLAYVTLTRRRRWHWNRWLAAALALLAVLGLLAQFRPTAAVGGVWLPEVSAGGLVGFAVAGDGVFGLLRVGVLAVAALVAASPTRASRLLRRAASLRVSLPRRATAPPRLVSAPMTPTPPPQPPAPPAAEAPQDVVALSEGTEAKEPSSEEEVATGPAGAAIYLPPIDLLDRAVEVEFSHADNVRRAELVEETLANYGVDARVVEINQGPTVTQFGIEPGWDIKTRRIAERDAEGRIRLDRNGQPVEHLDEVSRTRVKVNRITALSNDLALALAAPSIRIEAPVPGKSVVGIEVPNTQTTLVTLRSVIESTPFQRQRTRSKLAIALGKGVEGEAVVADLTRMPHLLIAGATGSGKSVCINTIITCLLMHTTPQEVRFLMIDPKRVELVNFNGTPHLLTPVISDLDRVVPLLRWAAREMDDRYRRLAAAGARNIEAYNRDAKVAQRMFYIVLIIDELADLMMVSPYEVERTICRLAQLARATGIHLVVATQRPSVDVVTGLIKANFPTRIAFAVTSQVDSRTIIDGGGAEKLLGRGDMLYMPTDAQKPRRLQGAFVSDAEIDRVTDFWQHSPWAGATTPLEMRLDEAAVEHVASSAAPYRDPMFERAKELAADHQQLSTSLLQRRLRVGYVRAARLMELLEEEGIVGPGEPGRSRQVIMPKGDS